MHFFFLITFNTYKMILWELILIRVFGRNHICVLDFRNICLSLVQYQGKIPRSVIDRFRSLKNYISECISLLWPQYWHITNGLKISVTNFTKLILHLWVYNSAAGTSYFPCWSSQCVFSITPFSFKSGRFLS